MNIYTKEKSTNTILKLSFNKLSNVYSWYDISKNYSLSKTKYKTKVQCISSLALSDGDFADIEIFNSNEEAKKYFGYLEEDE